MVEREEANDSGRWPINSRITRRNTYEYAGLIAPLRNCQGPDSVAFKKKNLGTTKGIRRPHTYTLEKKTELSGTHFFHSIASRAALLRRRAQKLPNLRARTELLNSVQS